MNHVFFWKCCRFPITFCKQASDCLSNFCLANFTYFCDVLNFSSPFPESGSMSPPQIFMSERADLKRFIFIFSIFYSIDDKIIVPSHLYSVRSFSIATIVSFVSSTALLNVFNSCNVRFSDCIAVKSWAPKYAMTFPDVTMIFSEELLIFPQSRRKFPKVFDSSLSWARPSLYFSSMLQSWLVDSLIDLKSSSLASNSLSLREIRWKYVTSYQKSSSEIFSTFPHLATIFSSSFPLNFLCSFFALRISQYWWFIVEFRLEN